MKWAHQNLYLRNTLRKCQWMKIGRTSTYTSCERQTHLGMEGSTTSNWAINWITNRILINMSNTKVVSVSSNLICIINIVCVYLEIVLSVCIMFSRWMNGRVIGLLSLFVTDSKLNWIWLKRIMEIEKQESFGHSWRYELYLKCVCFFECYKICISRILDVF